MEVETVLDFAARCGLEPRDYQARIIAKAFDAFTVTKFKNVLIESPTGSGKSAMGLLLCKLLEEKYGYSFGWVAMRRKLLLQAAKENDRIGVKNIKFVSMFDKNAGKFDFMIIDESQHDAAATMSDLHQDTAAKMSLGLTATPFRTDRIKLSFDKIINDCGVRFLIEKGYLSQFERLVIPDWLPATVATRFLEDRERWGKSVIYMKDKELCYETQERLVAGGVKAAVMLGSQSNNERNELFEQFEDGDLQVLINVYLLSEGFDCPELKSVWVRDSGKLCSMQMSGRVLRKDPKNPAKIANIIQSQQTWYPYTKCAKAQREYLWESNQWRSIEPSELSEKIAQIVQDIILPVPVFLPPYLDFAGKTMIRVGKNGQVEVSKRRRKENVVLMPGDFVPDDFDNADEEEYLE